MERRRHIDYYPSDSSLTFLPRRKAENFVFRMSQSHFCVTIIDKRVRKSIGRKTQGERGRGYEKRTGVRKRKNYEEESTLHLHLVLIYKILK